MRWLVLPGIGDTHWALCKLRGLDPDPEVWSWDFESRPRAEEYLRRCPWLRFGGYLKHSNAGELAEVFRRCYYEPGHEVQALPGWGYLLSLNGSLRCGLPWDQILPAVPTDYDYPLLVDVPEETGYVVASFSGHGMHGKWLQAFGVERIRAALRLIDGPIKLTGAAWDKDVADQVADGLDHVENLAGQTSIGEMLSLLRGARHAVGWIGGNLIAANKLGTPVTALWSRYFEATGFRTNWVRPGTDYQWLDVEALTPEELAGVVARA